MARSPTRTRKVLLALTLVMLAVVLAAWGVSYWRTAWVERSSQAWFPPETIGPGPFLGMLENRAEVLRVNRGMISLYASTHRTYSLEVPPKARVGDPARWSFAMEQAFSGGTRFLPPQAALPGGSMSFLGFRLQRYFGAWMDERELAIPLWFVALTLAAAAFGLLWPMRRSARRRAEGLCLHCGYDRRGLALAAACPECGETPAPAPPAA